MQRVLRIEIDLCNNFPKDPELMSGFYYIDLPV